MSTSAAYKIDLSLAPATVEALVDGDYSLYAMFAVRMTNAAARPTVAFVTQRLATNMVIEWTADVLAYTSSDPMVSGGLIQVGYQTPITLGQTFCVTAGGVGHLKAGPSSKIAIANTTSSSFTSGFARSISGADVPIPIYAAPLYGNQTNVAAPLPKILLLFTTADLRPGELVEKLVMKFLVTASYSPSILVMAAEDQVRKLSYDINAGWNWGSYSWAQVIPADGDFAKVLIERE